ncbi:MAG: S8 family serine peptidase, partial [Methanomassiliicoccales archaeon]
ILSLSPLPNVVSNSWGGYEDTWWNLYGPSWQSANALENYFMALTSMGVTVVAAAGDTGGIDTVSGLLSPDFPASSPFVLSVGGVQTVVSGLNQSTFPAVAPFNVSVTVAPYGYSELDSLPVWYPNYTLAGSPVTKLAQLYYWYYGPNSTVPEFASGGTGISYWFKQPWWQHGQSVPNLGRRLVADISAEADFNETVYFDGAWNFFWGGTSFAAPTVAGIISLLDGYLNIHLGSNLNSSYYLGLIQPLLYRIAADTHLPSSFFAVSSGSNPADITAASENLGWPGGQNWTDGWSSSVSGKYSLLTGLGVPDASSLASNALLLLNTSGPDDSFELLLNGSGIQTIVGNMSYSFTVKTSSGVPAPGIKIEADYFPASGYSINSTYVTSSAGIWNFNATGLHGYLTIYMESNNRSAFEVLWIQSPPLSGTLSISVHRDSSVMGGFALFNGLISSNPPVVSPLMPNTLLVSVYYANGTSSVPVYDATVLAAEINSSPFSSPPYSPNPYYNSSLLNFTALRSLSYTNVTGTALVETWNTAEPVIYRIAAFYGGLQVSTYVNVTPQLVVRGTISKTTYSASIPSTYLNVSAEDTITAPLPEGMIYYGLSVSASLWNGSELAGTTVSLAYVSASDPDTIHVLPHSTVITGETGKGTLLISSALDAMYASGDTFLVIAYNSSYNSIKTGTIPVLTNYSAALLIFEGSTLGETQVLMKTPLGNYVSTDYPGSTGNLISIYVSLAPSFVAFDNITSMNFTIDNGAINSVPLPSTGQSAFYWVSTLPVMNTGANFIYVELSDTLGLDYGMLLEVHVIAPGQDPPPVATILFPANGAYVSGITTVRFNSTESNYLQAETLAVGGNTYNVLGLNTFTFNASALPPRPLTLVLFAVNFNGLASSSVITVYPAPNSVPHAAITAPSANSTLLSSSYEASVTFGLSFSGDYIASETLAVYELGQIQRSPSFYNVTGMNSFSVNNLSPGRYMVVYTVRSLDGYSSQATINLTIVRSAGAFVPVIGTLELLAFGSLLVGCVFLGIFLEKFRERRRF